MVLQYDFGRRERCGMALPHGKTCRGVVRPYAVIETRNMFLRNQHTLDPDEKLAPPPVGFVVLFGCDQCGRKSARSIQCHSH